MSKVLICGDIHGDWGKLNALIASKKPDIVLQVGDFGWWPNEKYMGTDHRGRKKKWNPRGVKTNGTRVYFCDGNHEYHPSLRQTGHAQELYDNVWHCSRGTCLALPDGRKVLFAGGAHSIDRDRRIPGVDWFQEELISNADFDRMVTLTNKIDIVISHTCPTVFSVDGSLGKIRDSCRFALTEVLHRYNPDLWFFGHWHCHVKGKFRETRFEGLDYPGHGGRWWRWI